MSTAVVIEMMSCIDCWCCLTIFFPEVVLCLPTVRYEVANNCDGCVTLYTDVYMMPDKTFYTVLSLRVDVSHLDATTDRDKIQEAVSTAIRGNATKTDFLLPFRSKALQGLFIVSKELYASLSERNFALDKYISEREINVFQDFPFVDDKYDPDEEQFLLEGLQRKANDMLSDALRRGQEARAQYETLTNTGLEQCMNGTSALDVLQQRIFELEAQMMLCDRNNSEYESLRREYDKLYDDKHSHPMYLQWYNEKVDAFIELQNSIPDRPGVETELVEDWW